MRLAIVLGVALIAIVGAGHAKSTSSEVGECSKQDEGVTYGVPSDCHQYVVCKKGQLKVKECDSKYNYDTVTGKCVKAKNATCAVEERAEEPEPVEPEPVEPEPVEPVPEEPQESDDQYDYLCVKVLYGVRVHPSDCSKYLVCSKEKATIVYCGEGSIFVPGNIECAKGNQNTCAVEPEEPSTTPTPTTEATGKESEESDSGESSKESSEGSNESATGAPPTVTKPKPSDSDETDSGESSKENSGGKYDSLCAKKLLGTVAHPESCTKYIQCSLYKAKEESCKKGYSYSSKKGICVKQKNGECADDIQDPATTEPATEAPTTVTKPKPSESDESDSGESSKESSEGSTESATGAPPTVTKPKPSDSDETDSGESSKESSDGKYDSLCAKQLFGTLAHPETCTKYIQCALYKAKEENCKKGYAYSSKKGICVKQKNGECADDTEEPPVPTEAPTTEANSGESLPGQYDYVCASVAYGKVAHPETCTKYITCQNGKAKEESCKKGRYFSVYLKTCIKGNQETCVSGNGNGGSTATAQPPVTETSAPEQTTVAETSAPEQTTVAETSAPEQTTVTETSAPEQTTVTEAPGTDEPAPPVVTPPINGGDPMGPPTVECVEGFTGYLPIENDCTSYVYCFQGEPGVRACMEDYIYYEPLKACLPGDTVLCQLYSV